MDGRSDIYSLGTVLYELLVGRRPFAGATESELLRKISKQRPKPPRQSDDSIPRELERICLKMLAKRASERYATAGELADDVRHFLGLSQTTTAAEGRDVLADASPGDSAGTPSTKVIRSCRGVCPQRVCPQRVCPQWVCPQWLCQGAGSGSDSRPSGVVPKGLRSFDEHDADFFLDLLPGPRDRDGLPDSIRFWKRRIEEPDADKTFGVGLIYGPSGCGKSSLVKAGLLPRLSPPCGLSMWRRRRTTRKGGCCWGCESSLPRFPRISICQRCWPRFARVRSAARRESTGGARPVRTVAAREPQPEGTPLVEACGNATAAACSASSWCGTTSGWR